MSIFSYGFMIRALIVGLVLSCIIPLMGVVIVNKRMSVIGDALSHVSLAGVMIGLLAGTLPMIGAMFACVIAGLTLEFIRKKFPGYGEIATSIVMSTGVGLASLLSGFIRESVNFETFLFGSIVSISLEEFYLTLAISAVVFIVFLILYRDLMYICFDEVGARLSGVNVDFVNTLFMILVSITISIASRTVGVLIISSLMVIPVACAIRTSKSYFRTTILSSIFGIFFTEFGLVVSFYLGLKPGGTIVLIGVITLITILLFGKKN